MPARKNSPAEEEIPDLCHCFAGRQQKIEPGTKKKI
jgi:hypothetical protein